MSRPPAHEEVAIAPEVQALVSNERLDKLIANAGSREPALVAAVYAFRGETEKAFQWLQSPRSQFCIQRMMFASPFLKSLHADARWAQVTERKY